MANTNVAAARLSLCRRFHPKKEEAARVGERPLFMLSRFAGVSAAGACRRNPERSEGSLAHKKEEAACDRQTTSIYVGDDLLSHTLSRAVQSALRGLTSVFGMGTGISPAVKSPASLTWTRWFAPLGPSASFHAGPVTSILERPLAATSH